MKKTIFCIFNSQPVHKPFPIPINSCLFFLTVPALLTLLIFKCLFLGGIFSPLIIIAFKAHSRYFGEIIRGKKISKPQLKCNAELFWRAGIISPSSSHRRVCSELLASRATAVCLLSCLFVEKHLCSHSLIDKWVLPYVKSDLIQMPFLIGMLTTQDISKQ